MQALLFRLATLLIRFFCPLGALALSDAETMGAYYLFVSYFTFVIGISALELAIPFSRKFLRCKSDKQRQIMFTGFLNTQVLVTTILALPAGIVVADLIRIPLVLTPLFCVSLITEACVNEVGRFFWNIGEWKMPSLRDFIRAVVFTIAILVSVYVEKEILSVVTFLTISIGNLAIMLSEWMFFGGGRLPKNMHVLHLLKSTWLRVRRSLVGSINHFIQMQLLGLQPLLERILFEKTVGLAMLATFSFLTSVIQASSSLQLVPMVAKTRRHILSARLVKEHIRANQQAIRLSQKIALISGVWALIVYMAIPLLEELLGKQLNASPLLILIAYISSISAIFCSAVSPIFTVNGLALRANLLTALGMGFLLLAQYLEGSERALQLSLIVVCAVAIFQILGRFLFIRQVANG